MPSPSLPDTPELEAALARGAKAWPQLKVEREALRALSAHGGDLKAHAEDLYLAAACAAGVPGALEAFERTYFGDVDACVRSLGAHAPQSEEVCQRLRCRLFLASPGSTPAIARYAGTAELRSWFRVVALNEALTLRRAALREAPVPEVELADLPAVAEDPELSMARRLYGDAVRDALQRALGQVRDRDRAVLKLQVVDRLSIAQIGAVYGVHSVSAARRISAARARVAALTRRELRRRFNVPTQELDSLLRLIQSQVDLSVGRLLGALPSSS